MDFLLFPVSVLIILLRRFLSSFTALNVSFDIIIGLFDIDIYCSCFPSVFVFRFDSGKPSQYVLNTKTSPEYFSLANMFSILRLHHMLLPVGDNMLLLSSSRLIPIILLPAKHPWKAEVNEDDTSVPAATISGWYTQVYEPTFAAEG